MLFQQSSQFRFGISLMSLFPWSSLMPERVSEWAKQAGYGFLQWLPQRGIHGWENFALPVYYVERAWNPVRGFFQALRHQPGDEGMPSSLRDWLAFPSPANCRSSLFNLQDSYPKARAISHRLDNDLVEICPELDLSPQAIADFCLLDNIGLVLDTEHICRQYRDNDESHKTKLSPLLDYSEGGLNCSPAIDILAPHVQVIHLKNVWSEDDLRIVRRLMASSHQQRIDVVAEYKPTIASPAKTRAHMKDFLDSTKSFFAEFS